MSLAAQGVTKKDLIEIQPVSQSPGKDFQREQWTNQGDPIKVFSQKLTAQERFEAGKENTTYAYRIYGDLARGENPPLTEKMKIRHPDHTDATDGINVTSVIAYPSEGVFLVEAEYSD